MNCQEVMEYMQRELDGDLGELESAKLREHIRQCADCAAMYERLKRLSAELENLPKVTPPFSLVDAILPKLEEIDRAAAAASREAGAAGSRPGDAEMPEKTGSAPAAPRRRISRFNLRVLGGVVAAGIVAGIFLVTYDRDRLPDALTGSAFESASSGSSSSAASSGSSEPMLMFGKADQPLEVADVHDQSGSPLASSAFGGGAEDPDASAPAAPDSGSVRKDLTDPSGNSGMLAGSGAETTSGTGRDAKSGSEAGSGSGSGDDVGRISSPDVLPGKPDEPGAAGPEEPAGWLSEGMLGVAGFLEQPEASYVESVSPDGSYTAVFADSRVIIYDRDGNTRFEGGEREGSIAAFGWTDDGTFFRYELRRDDGAGEIYRIDPAAGTETREP